LNGRALVPGLASLPVGLTNNSAAVAALPGVATAKDTAAADSVWRARRLVKDFI
jgi:hypothetical protein